MCRMLCERGIATTPKCATIGTVQQKYFNVSNGTLFSTPRGQFNEADSPAHWRVISDIDGKRSTPVHGEPLPKITRINAPATDN
jgi:hypothetical protein